MYNMCLDINRLVHRKYGYDNHSLEYCHQPLIADRPLVIKKRAKYDNGVYYAPYRGTILPLGERLRTTFSHGYGDTIERGYHGFLYNATTQDWGDRNSLIFHCVTLLGVIPEGARYYIGHAKEVVSDQVIYFTCERDLLAYFNAKQLGDPVKKSP